MPVDELGAYRDYRADVLRGGDGVDSLEVIADHYLAAPPEKLRERDLLAERYTLMPHGLNLLLGTAEGLDPGGSVIAVNGRKAALEVVEVFAS